MDLTANKKVKKAVDKHLTEWYIE